jgi:hypothetical protein
MIRAWVSGARKRRPRVLKYVRIPLNKLTMYDGFVILIKRRPAVAPLKEINKKDIYRSEMRMICVVYQERLMLDSFLLMVFGLHTESSLH